MRTLLKVAALAAAVMLLAVPTLLPMAAFAESAVSSIAPAGSLNAGDIWTQAQPGIVDTVVAVVGLVALYLANLLRRRTGIDIEAQVRSIEANHRDALHSAVATALGAAASKFGLDKLSFEPTSPVGQFIVRLVNQSVPEAVKVLGAGEKWILTAAEAKLATGEVVLLPSKAPAP